MKIISMPGLTQPDPYVIRTGDSYYLYSTGGDGVQCYRSADLLTGWEYLGIVFSQAGQKQYWAPSVIERGGRFWLYYSSMPQGEKDTHTQNIKVAVSDRPDGGFTFVGDMLPPFSIDPHVVENECGLWMFYSVNRYEGDRVGTYIVVDAMADECTMRGAPVPVVLPTLEEEIFERDRFRPGQDWYTIEGAYYFRRDGWHYCIYSANCYEKATYHLGYASCRSDSGALDQLAFRKHSADRFDPLLCSDAQEISTGHNSMIEVGGQLYLVYHGRDAMSDLTVDDRTARVCRLFADHGLLRVERM